MARIVAAMNITIDGFCDHTAGIADDQLHQHYSDLLADGGALLYGRTTYQLMESHWPGIVKNPTGNKATDDFAVRIDNIPKIVFSHTLKSVDWQNARIAKRDLNDEVLFLKQQQGKDILVGSPSLITALTKSNLIDEYQLCIHPVIIGSGLPLFKTVSERIVLKLTKTKPFSSGAILHYYVPTVR